MSISSASSTADPGTPAPAPAPSLSPPSSLARSGGDAQLVVAASRPRQTEPPSPPFRDLLAGGVSVLMSGAEVATHVLAGPVMAAAVHQAGTTAAGAIGPAAAGGVAAAVPAGGELAAMQAMQRESQAFNLQLLELQEQVQQENRQFTTLSNVLRAKHDTAKAAVSNIRS
jgi:hypothetical protein